jgi:uncharacterized protein YecE (DUF72 family)
VRRHAQGHSSSIPPIVAATTDLAVVRPPGHSDRWDSKDIYQRFGYLYSDAELTEWAGRLRPLLEEAKTTHMLLNDCYRDHAHRNARTIADLLTDL